MKPQIPIALLAGAFLGAASMVAAQDRQGNDTALLATESVQVQSVTVPYSEAETRNQRGVESLFFRIRGAAAEVCDIAPNEVGYELWEEHACERAAVAEAVQDVGEPALIEYYSDLRGSALPAER